MARVLVPGRWSRSGHAVPDNQLSELDIELPPPIVHLQFPPSARKPPVLQRPVGRGRARTVATTVAAISLIFAGTFVLLAPIQVTEAVATLHVGHR